MFTFQQVFQESSSGVFQLAEPDQDPRMVFRTLVFHTQEWSFAHKKLDLREVFVAFGWSATNLMSFAF